MGGICDWPTAPEWTCEAYFYDANDGCDCNCGMYDPDCDLVESDLFNCPCSDMTCSPEGFCTGECLLGKNLVELSVRDLPLVSGSIDPVNKEGVIAELVLSSTVRWRVAFDSPVEGFEASDIQGPFIRLRSKSLKVPSVISPDKCSSLLPRCARVMARLS